MEIVQVERRREVKRVKECYNLDAIISVGYRVKRSIATQFWIPDGGEGPFRRS